MSPQSRSLRTFLPLFAAALFVGSVSAIAYYQNNDTDGTDDTSFSLPNPPVLAKYSSTHFGQPLLVALAPEQQVTFPIIVAWAPSFHTLLPHHAQAITSNDRGPPASLS